MAAESALPKNVRATRPAHLVPLRVPKAADVLAARLRRQIVRGVLSDDAELPPESQLMKLLEVGRPALREALRILESEGLLRVRRGPKGGATMHLPDIQSASKVSGLILQAGGTTFADLYQTRMLLEPAAARLVAEKGSRKTHAALVTAWREEEADGFTTPTFYAHRSAHFHQRLVDLAGLKTLAMLADLLADITDRLMVGSIMSSEESEATLQGQARAAHRAHGRLLELVQARDGNEAERFWRHHMDAAGQLLLGGGRGAMVIDVID
jgi:DNA-binding FadR family transcriptional regulator